MQIQTFAERQSPSRVDLWIDLINARRLAVVVEVGVWKGEFAEAVLAACPSVQTYYMVDPWRQLDNWNKPFNSDANLLTQAFEEAMARTEFARDRRVILRGTTLEVVDQVADASADLVYIDGDHTLRGITIDLLRWYPKARPGGIVGGDDYHETLWQHEERFEPTLVAPYALYFAEAMNNPIAILPHTQFAIEKTPGHAVLGRKDAAREVRNLVRRGT